jgi:hypothetical protein
MNGVDQVEPELLQPPRPRRRHARVRIAFSQESTMNATITQKIQPMWRQGTRLRA